MTDSHHPSSLTPTTDPAQLLAEHLLRYPADLIDSYRLLRRFRIATEDFQRALSLVERRTASLPPKADS